MTKDGFKLDGENTHDESGGSVSAAGDVNGDDYADVVIGAYQYPNGSCSGRIYVVFGGPKVGQNGGMLLSVSTGANGSATMAKIIGIIAAILLAPL